MHKPQPNEPMPAANADLTLGANSCGVDGMLGRSVSQTLSQSQRASSSSASSEGGNGKTRAFIISQSGGIKGERDMEGLGREDGRRRGFAMATG